MTYFTPQETSGLCALCGAPQHLHSDILRCPDVAIKGMVDAIFSHLQKPEVREELRRQQEKTDAYFKKLREDMTPSWEDLHRPFTI